MIYLRWLLLLQNINICDKIFVNTCHYFQEFSRLFSRSVAINICYTKSIRCFQFAKIAQFDMTEQFFDMSHIIWPSIEILWYNTQIRNELKMSFLNIEPNCETSPVNGSYLCRNGEFEMVDHLARCQAENKVYII